MSSPEQRLGLRYSSGLHLTMLLLAIFGLPELFEWTREPEPQAISVEILPISEISNVKPSETPPQKEEKAEEKPTPEIKPEPPKPEVKKPSEKPTPQVKTEEAKKDAVPLPDPKKKEEEKKKEEDKKKENDKKKQKQKEDELEAILKSVEKTASQNSAKPKDAAKDKTSASTSKSETYDDSLPLSISEKDAIRSQIERNWSPPIGARDAHDLKVVLEISLLQDGTVTDVKVKNKSSNPTFIAAAESAVRAVKMSSPLQNLPPDKYGSWKDVELVFDPKDALY